MLSTLGLTKVNIANNGREGVDKAQQTHYDLILMDINMPLLDGVCATKEIRDSRINTPVIAVTTLKNDSATFLATSMSDYIDKPVDKHLLVNLLTKWLVERGPSAEARELRSMYIHTFHLCIEFIIGY